MTSRPRVYARIRPQNDNETRNGGTKAFYAEKGHPDTLVMSRENGETVKTKFDRVFDNATQEEVFGHVGVEVMNTLFGGYNASVFAYGQTGSGKTFTMEGGHDNESQRGLIPRTIEAIFERFTSNKNITEPVVEMSFVQIYQERVQDLFNQRKPLEIHLDRTGQYVARGASWNSINSGKQALQLYDHGVSMRATNATEMNLVSSRSHTILMVKLQWDEPELPGCRAQLNLIDLAGSEKLNQSHAQGEVMKETIAINKSLSALGNVVSKLVEAAKHRDRRVHIPYKDSKLTYLLQSSLGGSNLVHFCLALSGSSLWKPESNATIDFGKRALQLVLKPARNPIDYQRLEEMENMIEKMRDRIRNLEGELTEAGKKDEAFMSMKKIHQEGEEDSERKRNRQKRNQSKKDLKTKTELARIVNNLPETLEDLTSHCVLFPKSKNDFRKMEGLEKLVQFIDKSPSTFYRAHAAHTVAHVIDDDGREAFGHCGGVEALGRLLQVREERCKEAACVALEAVVRSCTANKAKVSKQDYAALVDLVSGYANQQVQEAACTALASLVENYDQGKVMVAPLKLVEKLIETIDGAPEEVVHVTKAAATCLGRLAHGDEQMQGEIAKLGGVDLLIDQVLFSPVGDRDHQVPILASYALVNLCCSNQKTMAFAKRHPRWEEVQFRLVEGLARAFGNNCVRENFERATARETNSAFPYYGVTIMDKWTPLTCGGRPIFSTFMENPQFCLYISKDTKLTLMIQDVLYEQRMLQKQRNNTVYMGLAIFQGEQDLVQNGLKQLDFHGKMVEIAKFTSNCENVLHCTLKKSDTPYIVVPFTSQRGRSTTFALSAFGDEEVELTKIPENAGWVRRVVTGSWNEETGRTGDTFEWRNNPQVRVQTKEKSKVVFVLSYKSLDDARSGRKEEGAEDEKTNTRPRLHGRVFKHQFAPELRYLKALVPLPQQSTFVGTNGFSSNSYITTSVELEGNQPFVYVPFAETPHNDTWKLCVYSDGALDDLDVSPVGEPKSEWVSHSHRGVWKGDPVRMTVTTSGKMCLLASCKDTFLRLSVYSPDHERLCGADNFWTGECNAEYDVGSQVKSVVCVLEGLTKVDGEQKAASGGVFELFCFTSDVESSVNTHFNGHPSELCVVSRNNPKHAATALDYPKCVVDEEPEDGTDTNYPELDDDSDDYSDDGSGGGRAEIEALQGKLKESEQKRVAQAEEAKKDGERLKRENDALMQKLRENEQLITLLKRKTEEQGGGGGGGGVSGQSVGPPSATQYQFRGQTGAQNLVRQVNSRGAARRPLLSQGGVRRPSGSGDTKQHTPEGSQNLGFDPVDLSQQLGSLSNREKPPTPGDWAKIRKEMRDAQLKLMLSHAAGKQ